MQFRLSRWIPNTTRAGNSIAMSSSISLSILLQKTISPTLSCFLLLFRTLLFLKAPLAMWYPEPNAFWHVRLYHTECLLRAQLGDMSINAEAAHNCTGLVCCFHLPDNSRQLNCCSDFLGLFWQRGNAFQPNTRAALSLWVGAEASLSLSAGASHLFLCVTQVTYLFPHV